MQHGCFAESTVEVWILEMVGQHCGFKTGKIEKTLKENCLLNVSPESKRFVVDVEFFNKLRREVNSGTIDIPTHMSEILTALKEGWSMCYAYCSSEHMSTGIFSKIS